MCIRDRNRSAASLEMLLIEKGRELDHTITHLKKIKKMMSERQRDMSILREMDLSQMTVVDKVERHYLVTVDLSCGITLEKAIERLTAEAKGYQLRRLHDASYGSILPVEQLYQGNFSRYSALYMEVPDVYKRQALGRDIGGRNMIGDIERLPHVLIAGTTGSGKSVCTNSLIISLLYKSCLLYTSRCV